MSLSAVQSILISRGKYLWIFALTFGITKCGKKRGLHKVIPCGLLRIRYASRILLRSELRAFRRGIHYRNKCKSERPTDHLIKLQSRRTKNRESRYKFLISKRKISSFLCNGKKKEWCWNRVHLASAFSLLLKFFSTLFALLNCFKVLKNSCKCMCECACKCTCMTAMYELRSVDLLSPNDLFVLVRDILRLVGKPYSRSLPIRLRVHT